MTDHFYSGFLLLLQGAVEPQGGTSFLLVAAASIVSFIAGVLITVGFLREKARAESRKDLPGLPNFNGGMGVDIKHCSQCDSTYTNEDLNYCLRDGTPLRVVGTMPVPVDPEATRVINRNR